MCAVSLPNMSFMVQYFFFHIYKLISQVCENALEFLVGYRLVNVLNLGQGCVVVFLFLLYPLFISVIVFVLNE